MPGIAEHLLGDDRAVEDRAQRHRKAGDLGRQRVAHDVGGQDAVAVDPAVLGVGHVVLGDDVGDQGAHAHEPAADADQDQGQRGQDRVLEHAEDELGTEAAGHVHLVAAADRQNRPEVAEHDQQHEGHDVVGDRVEGHGDDAEPPSAAGCRDSSRQGRPSRLPSTQAIRVATTSRPIVQGRAFQIRNDTGVGKAESDGPKSATRTRCQKSTYCSHSVALEAVERAQRLAQHVDRFGAGAAERGRGRDRLLDRVDRRQVGDEERDVDADEDHQHELGEPFADVGAVAAAWVPGCGPVA